MPRIPVRPDPYPSPGRAQRHYRSRRDQSPRDAGTASHANKSHFAVIFVNERGEVETHASHLLQPYMPIWFDEQVQWSASQAILTAPQDQKLPGPDDIFGQVVSNECDMGIAKLDHTNLLNNPHFVSNNGQIISDADAAPNNNPGETMDFRLASFLPPYSEQIYFPMLHQLQQKTCKAIARCWINVIEPNKQVLFPFQGGEDARPSWWPLNLVHRDPDHLQKQGRNALLLAILQSGRATVTQLEITTDEVMGFLSSEKKSVLRELYMQAKVDERRIQEGTPMASSENYYGEGPIPLGFAHLPSARGKASVPLPVSSTNIPAPGLALPWKAATLERQTSDDKAHVDRSNFVYSTNLSTPQQTQSSFAPSNSITSNNGEHIESAHVANSSREVLGSMPDVHGWLSATEAGGGHASQNTRPSARLTIDVGRAQQLAGIPDGYYGGGHSAPPLGDHTFESHGYLPPQPLTAGAHAISDFANPFEGFGAMAFHPNIWEHASVGNHSASLTTPNTSPDSKQLGMFVGQYAFDFSVPV